jgi:hypothetical protein
MSNVNLIGILGLVSIAACWSLAVLLYRVGHTGSVGRMLAVLLVIEGLALITAGYPEFATGVWERSEQFPVAYHVANFFTHHLADALMLALYPPFLAAALMTPLTRPFARKSVRIPLTIVALLMAPGTVISFGVFGSRIGSNLLYASVMVLYIFALVAAIDAWRRSDPGLARVRARAFVLAFGIRDICWGFTYGASFYMSYTDTFDPQYDLFWIVKVVYALGTLLAVPLIAYGILTARMFDIDLKIRWTIKQSTLAGAVVAIMFVLTEAADRFLTAELGEWTGLLAAAIVIFLLTPLQRFAESVASKAMPNTENTPEYIAFRKMQVYENALRDALADGGVSAKERALLGTLRESLGISEGDAEVIEAELRERLDGDAAHNAPQPA